MNYIGLLSAGIAIMIFMATALIYKTYESIKKKEKRSRTFFKFILYLFLFSITSIAYISGAYNSLCTDAYKFIEQGECQNVIGPLEKALLIRNTIGERSKYFDKKIFGHFKPMFCWSESEVRLLLARNYESKNRAFEEYKKVISIEKDNLEALCGLAEILFLKHDYEGSRYYYDKFIKVKPKELDADYYFCLGKANMVLQNFEESLKFFNKSIELGKEEEIVKMYIKRIKAHIEKIEALQNRDS